MYSPFWQTVVAAFFAIGSGSLPVPVPDIFKTIFGQGEAQYNVIILGIRLPRVLAAVLVGAALAVSGAVMQCVLRNPLASASTLGVSQGAAFGAALGIIVFGGGVVNSDSAATAIAVNNPYIVTLCAFLCGSVSSLVVILLSRLKKNLGPGGLILAGVALKFPVRGGDHPDPIFCGCNKNQRAYILDVRKPGIGQLARTCDPCGRIICGDGVFFIKPLEL